MIFCRLRTKVHDILRRCKRARVSNAFAGLRVAYHVSFGRYRQSGNDVGNHDEGSPTSSRNFVNFGPNSLRGPPFLPILRKFCILLHCQASHTEVSKQNSIKLCDMLGSEPDLQMHVKNLRGSPPPKHWEAKN